MYQLALFLSVHQIDAMTKKDIQINFIIMLIEKEQIEIVLGNQI